jgi:hypothetical protein
MKAARIIDDQTLVVGTVGISLGGQFDFTLAPQRVEPAAIVSGDD